MFIPLGLYVAHFMKQFKFWSALGVVMGTSFIIEVFQFVFKRGASDIDDVLLNTIGGFIGILIYLIFKTLLKSKGRVHMAISILSLVVGIPIFSLTIILVLAN